MADENEILLKVVLDEEATEKRIVELRSQIRFLKDEVKELDKEFKEGKVDVTQYEAALERNRRQSVEATKELNQQRKALEDSSKAQKSAVGSIQEMRSNLSLMTAGYIQLSKAERENEDVGEALQKRIKALSDELKENEEKLGDNRRSVGDYLKVVRVGGVSVGEMQEALKKGGEAFQVFTKGISLSKGALIALGAVPILLILTGLVALLTKSQKGMDLLAQGAKAVDLALTSLTQGFVKIGQVVVDSFKSWEKFKNLLSDVGAVSRQTTLNMIDAAKAGIEIEKTNQRLEASETSLSVVRAKNRAEIERLKLLAEDTSKSNALRSAAAKRAFDLENSTMQQSIKLQKERIANVQREYELGGKTRADAQKVADEQIKLAEIQEDSLGKQTELNNNLNSIRQDGITKAKEAAALAAQEAIAQAEAALIMAKRKGEDTLKIEEELIKRRAAAEKLAAEKGAKQRSLIALKAEQEILELRVQKALEAAKRTLSIQQSENAAALALTLRNSAEAGAIQIAEIRRQAKEQLVEVEADYKNRKITVEQYTARMAEIQNASNRAIDDVRQQIAQAEVNRLDALAQSRLQTEQDLGKGTLNEIRQIAAARIDQEEKTQLALLAIEELSDEDRLTKQNAIQAKAIAQRRELERQLRADVRADEQADIDVKLAESRSGSTAEFRAKKEQLHLEMQAELDNSALTEKQKAAIRAKYRRAEKDLEREHTKAVVDQVTTAASQSINILASIMEAQSKRLFDELDKQQQFAVKSAGTNADLREKIETKFAKKREQLEKEQAEKRKKIAIAETIINGAKAVVEASPNILLMALAGLTTFAELAVIQQQKFADGGLAQYVRNYVSDQRGNYIGSGPGTGRSDSIPARISVGESIINAEATRKHYDLLSTINASTGGRRFPGAKEVRTQEYQFNMGGVASLGSDTGSLARSIAEQINAVQTVLVVDDVNAVNTRKGKVSRRTTVA